MVARLSPDRSVLAVIGQTPMLELKKVVPPGCATIQVKAEFMNPGGSLKDRIARYIIAKAEERGELRPDSIILEVTSGNSGIAFSMVGALKGYRVRILMPRGVSVERRQMLAAFGAELELLEDGCSMREADVLTEEVARRDERIFLPRQFSNPDNPQAHLEETGPEIIAQCGPEIDAFVMGAGTGGTLMGVGAALRHVNPEVQIIAVEPSESALLSGGEECCHGIQGISPGFIPEIIRVKYLDRVMTIETAEAIRMAVRLAREEGLFVGITSGANVVAALRIAAELGPGRRVVSVLCDRGERYLSIFK
jgi:cysteine synthase A